MLCARVCVCVCVCALLNDKTCVCACCLGGLLMYHLRWINVLPVFGCNQELHNRRRADRSSILVSKSTHTCSNGLLSNNQLIIAVARYAILSLGSNV